MVTSASFLLVFVGPQSSLQYLQSKLSFEETPSYPSLLSSCHYAHCSNKVSTLVLCLTIIMVTSASFLLVSFAPQASCQIVQSNESWKALLPPFPICPHVNALPKFVSVMLRAINPSCVVTQQWPGDLLLLPWGCLSLPPGHFLPPQRVQH